MIVTIGGSLLEDKNCIFADLLSFSIFGFVTSRSALEGGVERAFSLNFLAGCWLNYSENHPLNYFY